MDYDLKMAHADYREVIPKIIEGLLIKWPEAALVQVYVGKPRREHDISMGYYDENAKKVWLNGYWFGKPASVLQEAALSPPFFHGEMTAEPQHVITHEFGHSVDWANHQRIAKRRKEVWELATRDPKAVVAAYGLTNDTEYFAELFAAVELRLAREGETAKFRYVMEA